MKKFLSAIMALVMVIGIGFCVPVTADAANSDIFDLRLLFVLSADGNSYEVAGYEIEYSSGDESEAGIFNNGVLEIPAVYNYMPVTGIAENAFIGCNQIQSIVIPDTVKRIGDFAFGNSTIGVIYNGNKVEVLGDYAFYNCDNIGAINLFSDTKEVGSYCFYDCSRLMSVNLNTKLATIGDFAFFYCKNLESVSIPNNVSTTIPIITTHENKTTKRLFCIS